MNKKNHKNIRKVQNCKKGRNFKRLMWCLNLPSGKGQNFFSETICKETTFLNISKKNERQKLKILLN